MTGYNHIYRIGWFCLQILLPRHKGAVIQLFPAVVLTVHGQLLLVGVGLEWIGSVNFGIMNKAFRESETARIERIQEHAMKCGLTFRQQELRHGW